MKGLPAPPGALNGLARVRGLALVAVVGGDAWLANGDGRCFLPLAFGCVSATSATSSSASELLGLGERRGGGGEGVRIFLGLDWDPITSTLSANCTRLSGLGDPEAAAANPTVFAGGERSGGVPEPDEVPGAGVAPEAMSCSIMLFVASTPRDLERTCPLGRSAGSKSSGLGLGLGLGLELPARPTSSLTVRVS